MCYHRSLEVPCAVHVLEMSPDFELIKRIRSIVDTFQSFACNVSEVENPDGGSKLFRI